MLLVCPYNYYLIISLFYRLLTTLDMDTVAVPTIFTSVRHRMAIHANFQLQFK